MFLVDQYNSAICLSNQYTITYQIGYGYQFRYYTFIFLMILAASSMAKYPPYSPVTYQLYVAG